MTEDKKQHFPIVGIGASAGGLDALDDFFSNVPDNPEMAFVVIQHLSPDHESVLSELLQRNTDLEVTQVKDGMTIKPNRVYVIPPNHNMIIEDGELCLQDRPDSPTAQMPIDHFFRSMASELGGRAICIILSGTGSDGSLGLKAVKEQEGMAMVQEPETAEYDGMPRRAIDTDMVDYIMEPPEMPQALLDYVNQVPIDPEKRARRIERINDDSMRQIHSLLREHTEHDFSQYKKSTLMRRIQRRMVINRIETMDEYADYLESNSAETESLFKEILIGVTSFFRDRQRFIALRQRVIKPLVTESEHLDELRIWVPGCSTGEEAYSIAMMIQDVMSETGIRRDFQIFATDIDSRAIEKARNSNYPRNIVADVPQDYLNRYFLEKNDTYRVSEQIRSNVIFAEHSIIKDPPFSRLDLISCRNLLIYLESNLQQKVIAMFHYALRSGGYLFLGSSETVSGKPNLFDVESREHKIFQRRDVNNPNRTSFNFVGIRRKSSQNTQETDRQTIDNIRQLGERVLLQRYTPAAVLVNDEGQIVYFLNDTRPFLRPAEGKPSQNIRQMAHEDLEMQLVTSLRKALSQNRRITQDNLRIQTDNGVKTVHVEFEPVGGQDTPDLILITFEFTGTATKVSGNAADTTESDDAAKAEDKSERVAELEQELEATREYLQTTVEELETSNEELKATNEELQSSNEELQSTNEELETAREELQYINEELSTVNSELNSKIDELERANNDLTNLLDHMEIGILFLDAERNVRLYNPVAGDLLNLIETDVGRPLQHLASNFDYDNLQEDVNEVLNTLEPRSFEAQSNNGEWFAVSIRAYRTSDGDVDGVIITFSNIEEQKRAQTELSTEQALQRMLLQNLPGAAALLFDETKNHRVIGGEAKKRFGLPDADGDGDKTGLYDLLNTPDNLTTLKKLYERTLNGESLQLKIRRENVLFQVRTSPVTYEDNPWGTLLAWDISDETGKEQQLFSDSLPYRVLLRQLPNIGVVIFDHDYRFVMAEGDILEEAGYPIKNIAGSTLDDIFVTSRSDDWRPIYDAALSGRDDDFTHVIDGQTFQIEPYALRDDEGDVLFGMLVIERQQKSGNQDDEQE